MNTMNKNIQSMRSPGTRRAWCGRMLLLAWLALLPVDLQAQVNKNTLKRHAILHMSDGEQREGIIELSRGTEFELTNLSRDNTGETATVEAAGFSGKKHKVYTFNFNVVKR